MKKTILITIAILNFLFSNLIAQENQKNILKMNPLSLIVGTTNFQFERVIGKKQSVQIGVAHTNYTYDFFDDTESELGFIISLQFRNYLSQKTAPRGCYIAPFIRNFNLKEYSVPGPSSIPPENTLMNSFGGGAIIGFQGVGKKFSLDLYAGPCYYYLNKGDKNTFKRKGFNFIVGMAFGITI